MAGGLMSSWVTCFVSVVSFLSVGCASTAAHKTAFIQTQGLSSRDYWVCVSNTSGYIGGRREAINRCLEGKKREQSNTQSTTN